MSAYTSVNPATGPSSAPATADDGEALSGFFDQLQEFSIGGRKALERLIAETAAQRLRIQSLGLELQQLGQRACGLERARVVEREESQGRLKGARSKLDETEKRLAESLARLEALREELAQARGRAQVAEQALAAASVAHQRELQRVREEERGKFERELQGARSDHERARSASRVEHDARLATEASALAEANHRADLLQARLVELDRENERMKRFEHAFRAAKASLEAERLARSVEPAEAGARIESLEKRLAESDRENERLRHLNQSMMAMLKGS